MMDEHDIATTVRSVSTPRVHLDASKNAEALFPKLADRSDKETT